MDLKDQGYLAMGGQIIDASIVAVPKQRNSRKENARIKGGETPECWQDKPAKRECRGPGGPRSTAGAITATRTMSTWRGSWCGEVHEVTIDILDGDNTALGVWADSAYRSAEIEAALKKKGLRSRIHANKPLSEREKQGQHRRFVGSGPRRACFRGQSNDMGGTLLRVNEHRDYAGVRCQPEHRRSCWRVTS